MIEMAVMTLVLACLGAVGGIIAGYFDRLFLHKSPEHKLRVWLGADYTPADFSIIGHWQRTGRVDSNGYQEWEQV